MDSVHNDLAHALEKEEEVEECVAFCLPVVAHLRVLKSCRPQSTTVRSITFSPACSICLLSVYFNSADVHCTPAPFFFGRGEISWVILRFFFRSMVMITKVLGIEKIPPPFREKSQIIPYFFLEGVPKSCILCWSK